MKRTIYTKGPFRIIEIPDEFATLENLEGDCFCLKVNPDQDAKQLEIDQKKFRQKVYDEGVFGYVLEKWNPEVGVGWETVDSCWGFVGQYQEDAESIMILLMEQTIEKEANK